MFWGTLPSLLSLLFGIQHVSSLVQHCVVCVWGGVAPVPSILLQDFQGFVFLSPLQLTYMVGLFLIIIYPFAF